MGILFKVIALLPLTPGIRGNIYRWLVKKRKAGRIGKGFRIGYGSYIDSVEMHIGDNVHLNNLVRMKFMDKVVVGNNTTFGSGTIVCGAYENKKWACRTLKVGSDSEILSSHYFDVVAPIVIGNNVTIAGKWTQFYTHSFDLDKSRLDGSIAIGNHVYIGAGCIINLGVKICDNVVLQGGTCVNKSINEEGVYMSNTFARRGSVHRYLNDQRKYEKKILEDGSIAFRNSRE